MPFKEGNFIRYKGAGKIARLEGKAGKWCMATVKDVYVEDGVVKLRVLPWHRFEEGSDFYSMAAVVEADDAYLVESHAEAQRIFRNK